MVLGKCRHIIGIFKSKITNAYPTQRTQISSYTQLLPKVAYQAPNISPLATGHLKLDPRYIDSSNYKRMDENLPRRQLSCLPLPCLFVRPLSLDLNSGVGWWYLVNASHKSRH